MNTLKTPRPTLQSLSEYRVSPGAGSTRIIPSKIESESDMHDGLNAVDLFCGAGGFSLGFHSAEFNILAGTDIHNTAAKTYKHNLDTPCVVEDIRDLKPKQFYEKGGFDPADVDVVIGGPPCKGFSTAGPYNVDDPRNSLFRPYLELVKDIRPQAIVMENVTGLLGMENGEFKDQILEYTRGLGYNTEFIQLNAANYGVPQLRERIFFIGYLDDHPIKRPPRTHSGPGQKRLEGFSGSDLEDHVTTQEAIGDLEFLGIGEHKHKYEGPPQTSYQDKMRGNNEILYNHKSSAHSRRIRDRFEKFDQGESVQELQRRLDDPLETQKHTIIRWNPKKPANTVTTLPEDFIHYKHNRIPTVRELARIQSFPDWFEFMGPRTTGGPQRSDSLPQYSQVGNAVPPLLAREIAREIRKRLTGDAGTMAPIANPTT